MFLDLLPRACWGAAEQLCGTGSLIYPAGKLADPRHNFAHPGANAEGVGSPGQACRGVYANFPPKFDSEADRRAASAANITGGHVDGWDGDRWRVSVNTTLDDVGPGGGAFAVWPGSQCVARFCLSLSLSLAARLSLCLNVSLYLSCMSCLYCLSCLSDL